jgi:small-conductance mechanosensitive channel
MRRLKCSASTLLVLTFLGVTICASLAYGQMMPGMELPKKEQPQAAEQAPAATSARPVTPEEKKEAVEKIIQDEQPSSLRKIYLRYLSEYSPYRGVGLAVLTLLVLLTLKKYATRLMRQYAHPKVHKPENLESFLKTWNMLWKVVIGVFVILALSGSLKLLGLSAAFVGMMLGWSLQAPVTGIAAWLMILLKRPFRIGDRVIIAGIIGDVSDITLTHVIMNQVGGTIGGEEPSGRAVLIPNAILFGQVIMNYTLQEDYMLDEVPVRLTFDSDYQLAEKIMLDAAREVVADIIKQTGKEPFTRCEFFDAGVLVRLRYQTIPAKRQETSSEITERIMAGFKDQYPAVKYCYPHAVVRYRWQEE